MSLLILFNKPYDVLCQFTDSGNRPTLSQYITKKGVYPAGRLDKDSEGLLVLTNDGALQKRISDPKYKLAKTYWVQVEGRIDADTLGQLRRGVLLKDGLTKPARAAKMAAPDLWPRTPPIRKRKNIPTSWITLTICEGKNRQVRRMTAAVGFPTLRLIRYAVGNWTIDGLASGHCKIESTTY